MDKLKDPVVKEFAKGVTALYGIAGVGLGVLVLLLSFVAKPVVLSEGQVDAIDETSEYGEYLAQGYVNELARSVVDLLPILAVLGAVFVGLYAARSFAGDDQTALVAAGSSSFVGSLVMVVVGGYFAASQVSSREDIAEEAGTRAVSEFQVQATDLVVNALAVGAAAAIVAAATAYAYDNYLAASL